MARKRRIAPKILLHPMFSWIRGRMGEIVYQRCRSQGHDGEIAKRMS